MILGALYDILSILLVDVDVNVDDNNNVTNIAVLIASNEIADATTDGTVTQKFKYFNAILYLS